MGRRRPCWVFLICVISSLVGGLSEISPHVSFPDRGLVEFDGTHSSPETKSVLSPSPQKVEQNIEHYVSRTPYISEDGGVTLGLKKTTAFLVNARTGKILHTFTLSDSSAELKVQDTGEKPRLLGTTSEDLTAGKQLLYITRTDYALKSFYPNSKKVAWSLTAAEIEAVFQCKGIENSVFKSDSKHEDSFEKPLSCWTRTIVHRTRGHNALDSLSGSDMLPKALPAGFMLSLPASNDHSHFEPIYRLPGSNRKETDTNILYLPSSAHQPEDWSIHGRNAGVAGIYLTVVVGLLLLVIAGFVFRHHPLKFREFISFNKEAENLKRQTAVSKRKRARKSGISKNRSDVDAKEKDVSHEFKDQSSSLDPHGRSDDNLTFPNLVDGSVVGRRIGKLNVHNKLIATGSNGTIVLEGIYDGRPVAVKRLVQTHHEVALKEIQNLIASDQHPNIIRWYGVEHDADFIYLSLERCTCSLNDLIFLCADTSLSSMANKDVGSDLMDENQLQLDSLMEIKGDLELWKANGFPSLQLLKLMRDLVCGLAHLHELGIIHRDLKPQNVLIVKERSLCAKLSDMGISKRLSGDNASLTQHATGCGSSGWQAPEQLLNGRQTRAIDLFSLGCVLYFCITGGRHPFGDRFERDMNIVNNQKDLYLVEDIPEAVELLSSLLNPNPDMRPTALDVLCHPFFWDAEMRLSFLRDVSDRIELEDRESESDLLKALENTAAKALSGMWDKKMETAFVNNIGRNKGLSKTEFVSSSCEGAEKPERGPGPISSGITGKGKDSLLIGANPTRCTR
ncbi:KEN domain [Dillenia turbinata]|uniref:non-specific serine/threonine protein kinase n=1 Tax=Dillenia turbinata TaxID=194707 RepID=A0AAN8ZII4_9MAGN